MPFHEAKQHCLSIISNLRMLIIVGSCIFADKICRKRSLNCLSEASFKTPDKFEQRRVSASGGQVNGCPFGFLLGKQKEHKKIKRYST
jgi:hypothetical protein